MNTAGKQYLSWARLKCNPLSSFCLFTTKQFSVNWADVFCLLMNRGEKNIEDYKSLWHSGHVWTEEDKICTNAHKFHSILASGLAEPTLQHVHSQSPPRPAGHPTVPPAVYFKHQRNTERFTVWVVPWNSSKMFPPRQCKIAETLTTNCLSCLVPNNCLMRKLTQILGHGWRCIIHDFILEPNGFQYFKLKACK